MDHIIEKGILIKYGEITLKGNNRAQFENVLIRNIKVSLSSLGEMHLEKEQGRLLLTLPDPSLLEEACRMLQKVFGIYSICPVDILSDNDMDTITQTACEYVGREYDSPHTFKVFAKRTDKSYPLDSMSIAAAIGEKILSAYPDWRVDVHAPEVKLYAELRTRTYLYGKELMGQGGLPVGTGGRATLLLSGGIDSPVAGYLMAKRGLSLSAVYFHAHPYTSDRARDKVLDLASIVSRYAGPICVYVVPFTDIQLQIIEKCPREKLTIIMRRIMMKIAEKIAAEEHASALITGESLGQVASQTLASLVCTDDAASMPVFRPVIGMDKQEIIEIAKRIETFETSILPYEDCCTIFVAKHPTTQPRLESIKEAEEALTDMEERIDKAVSDSVRYLCRPEGYREISGNP